MLLIRRFEERAGQLYGMGLIGGFCHLYIGQEAVAVGMQAAAPPHQAAGATSVITGYRDHGHMLACGMDPKGGDGRADRPRRRLSKGKGGSMHMFSSSNFYGGHGIVGAQVPLGTGLGLRQQIPRQRRRLPRLFRRRRGQPGPGLRELQHGRALEAAGHLRDREQPIRHGHLGRALLGRDQLYKRGESFRIPASRSTAWTCSRCAAPPRPRSNGCAPARGRSSWR
jgi:pyruvate dehydrogenase E1 component alpha subunit